MKNKINSTTTLISISLLILTSFTIFFTYFSEKTEIAVATIQNNQETNQSVTQEKGAEENKKIVQQAVVTSSPDPLPGHEAHQSVTVLRLKGDNTIYEGTLSFIASKPVEVQILYRNMTSLSQQLPQISPQFGTMSIIPLPGDQGSVISSLIQPQYPEEATSFSASIPFAGNGLALHNLAGDEFVATYTVVADQVGQAQRADEIVNPPPDEDEENGGGDNEDENEENGGGDNEDEDEEG
ncbi:MAG TPA: hypothetical protein VFM28_03545 [Nitrososphaeraceae archaeon]|nr:hypothetical protein [Nitrososphaeraceae archaeon]